MLAKPGAYHHQNFWQPFRGLSVAKSAWKEYNIEEDVVHRTAWVSLSFNVRTWLWPGMYVVQNVISQVEIDLILIVARNPNRL